MPKIYKNARNMQKYTNYPEQRDIVTNYNYYFLVEFTKIIKLHKDPQFVGNISKIARKDTNRPR